MGTCAQNCALPLRWAWAHVRLPLCSRSVEQIPCPGHTHQAVRLVFAMGVAHVRACSRSADAECVHHAQRRPQCHRQWRLLDAALTPSFKVFKAVFRPLSVRMEGIFYASTKTNIGRASEPSEPVVGMACKKERKLDYAIQRPLIINKKNQTIICNPRQ
jgi:hypothetical protein